MDVACQDSQDLKERLERMDNPESQALPELQEIPANHQHHLASQPLLHHANHVHKDLPDQPAHQEVPATQEKLELQDDQELMLLPEALAHADLQDHQENPAQSDQMENPVFRLNPNLWSQESQENLEIKDHLDHLAHQEHPETTDLPAHLDQKANLDPMALPDKMDKPDHQDLPEAVEPLERRVFAPNTALSTEVFSSKMVHVVKFEFDRILYDSQASSLQRNAVFFLFLSPLIVYGNLGEARERWKIHSSFTLLLNPYSIFKLLNNQKVQTSDKSSTLSIFVNNVANCLL